MSNKAKYFLNILRVFILLSVIGLISLSGIKAQGEVALSTSIGQYNGLNYYLHTVEPRQTLYSIAKAYRVSMENILMANPEARSGLRVKQVLRIPTSEKTTVPIDINQPAQADAPITETHDYIYHVAGKNQTFNYIANIYVVSENLVKAANPRIKEPIPEGEYVIVPLNLKTDISVNTNPNRPDLNPYTRPVSRRTETVNAASDKTDSKAKPEKRANTSISKNIPAQNTEATPTVISPATSIQAVESSVQSSGAQTSSQSLPEIIWPAVDYGQHLVKPKETLYSIARLYGLKIEDLNDLNPGLAENLKIGQILRLPPNAAVKNEGRKRQDTNTNVVSGEKTLQQLEQPVQTLSSPKADTAIINYTVKQGETIYRIAVNHGVNVEELKRLNPGLTDRIRPGQQITVPKKKIAPDFILHRAENREKAESIAQKYGLKLADLQNANPWIKRNVKAGDLVKIPVKKFIPKTDKIFKEQQPNENELDAISIDDLNDVVSNCQGRFDYRQKTFRVALLIPFFLSKNETLNFSVRPDSDIEEIANREEFTFIGFYEGFLLAVDSLVRSQGLQIELMVFDVDQINSKTNDAIEKMSTQKPDLIVGPFFNKAFDRVATFARSHNIMIVNPMAQRSEILENFPNVVKLKPDQDSQLRNVASMILQYYPNGKVFLFQPRSGVYDDQIIQLKNILNNSLPQKVNIPNEKIYNLAVKSNSQGRIIRVSPYVTVEGKTFSTDWLKQNIYDSSSIDNQIFNYRYSQDSIKLLSQMVSSVRENIVIAYAEDNVFAMEFMNKLNQITDTFNIRLFGLPNWDKFDNLFPESLLNMNAHYVVQSHVDYNSIFTDQFIYKYRNQFGTEPDQYAYEGFDAAWYFLQALMHFDRSAISCISSFNANLLQTKYVLQRKSENQGLENVYWNVYRFDKFKLSLLPLNLQSIQSLR